MGLDALKVSRRIKINDKVGTIKYLGPLPKKPEVDLYLGLDYDRDELGKHDGCFGGSRLFQATFAKSGSFIKVNDSLLKSVQLGLDLLAVLSEKYFSTNSNGPIKLNRFNKVEVELIGFDKVEDNLRNPTKLKVVSLNHTLVDRVDSFEQVSQALPELVDLDLSNTLISSFDLVYNLLLSLNKLESLHLNRNKMELYTEDKFPTQLFNLCKLSLNGTLLDWVTVYKLGSKLPNLTHLQLGNNQLTSIGLENYPNSFSKLKFLNLEDNWILGGLASFIGLSTFPNIRQLDLSYNRIVELPGDDQILSQSLSWLNLNFNQLPQLTQFKFVPNLIKLNVLGNPFIEKLDHDFSATIPVARIITIATLPNLTNLNNTLITAKEREDCELFYCNQLAPENYHSVPKATFQTQFPTFLDLVQKYQLEHLLEPKKFQSTNLKAKLLQLQVNVATKLKEKDNVNQVQSSESFTFTISGESTLKQLKLSLSKKLNLLPTKLDVYQTINAQLFKLEDENKPLSHFSLENDLYVTTKPKRA